MSGVMDKMKAYVATFGTETNSFIEFPTTIQDFHDCCLYYNGAYSKPPNILSTLQIRLADLLGAMGYDVEHGLCAFGNVSGPLTHETYAELSQEIIAEVKAFKPDVILLFVHGAMVSERHLDAEGVFLETLRTEVGAKVKIGAVLDLHVNLSDRMLKAADLLIGCKEYPHDDFPVACESLVNLIHRQMQGEINPVTRYFDCRLIGLFGTKEGAMKAHVDKFRALERDGEVLQAWAAHGFPWGDTLDTSFKVVVTTDGDAQKAQSLAEKLGMEIYEDRRLLPMTIHHPEDIGNIVQDLPKGPLVLGDIADNPMGGAPGDATFLLRHLIENETRASAFSAICDPALVSSLADAEVGATVEISLGGKISGHSGEPITGEALLLQKHSSKSVIVKAESIVGEASVDLGDTVVLRIKSVDVVVSSLPVQSVAPSFFSDFDLEPSEYAILAVKSTQHFAAYFAETAGAFAYISTPGALVQDYEKLPYQHLDRQSIWPLAADPLQSAGSGSSWEPAA